MNKLKNLRESANISQEYVASELSITQGAVSQWENSYTVPQTRYLYKLSKLYNCSIDDLLDWSSIDWSVI